MSATTVPEGLFYYNSAVSRDLEDDIERWFEDEDVQTSLFAVSNVQGKSSEDARKVLHFGWKYNYSTGGTGERAEDFPVVITALRNIIPKIWKNAPPDFSVESLDQCIVNRYMPGQGIGAHSDSNAYGDVIVCFTFKGSREMEFTRGSESYRVYTRPASMYVMSGESRHEWKHQMRARKIDTIAGKKVPRTECFSITFRGIRREPQSTGKKKAAKKVH